LSWTLTKAKELAEHATIHDAILRIADALIECSGRYLEWELKRLREAEAGNPEAYE
jgi:hypothetical protein